MTTVERHFDKINDIISETIQSFSTLKTIQFYCNKLRSCRIKCTPFTSNTAFQCFCGKVHAPFSFAFSFASCTIANKINIFAVAIQIIQANKIDFSRFWKERAPSLGKIPHCFDLILLFTKIRYLSARLVSALTSTKPGFHFALCLSHINAFSLGFVSVFVYIH